MSSFPSTIAVFMLATVAGANVPLPDIKTVTLERTTCDGTCPAYRITISADGTVRYDGRDFVRVKGRRAGRISPEAFRKLADKLRQIHFFQLEDRYDSREINEQMVVTTDLPTTITSVTSGGRTKKVTDYDGGPKRLYELEGLIDELAHSEIWVGKTINSNKDVPYYESFPLHRVLTFRALLEGTSSSSSDLALKPPKYSKYTLTLIHNALSFDIHADPMTNLSRFAGCIVDATGRLEEDPRSRGLVYRLSQVRFIRRYQETGQ